MKKGLRIMAAGLCAVLMLAGCGNKAADGDYSKYVKLGQYKGVEITNIPDVTEEELDTEMAARFRGTVEEGDTVVIDYVGTLDGVAFDGGTAQGQYLPIGSNTYIDGFEEGLVGVEVGSTVDLNLSFPDPYENNPDLAGKAVVFTVTVNAIDGVVGAEMTEEVIKENTSYGSLAAYRESVREELQLVKDNEKLAEIWEIVDANTVISGYPQEEVDVYAADMKSYYETMASMYGIDLTTLLTANSMTEDDFNNYCQEYGKEQCKKYMILATIAQAEGIELSDEEYNEEVQKIVDESGMTLEEVVEYYGGEEEIRKSLLYNKVLEFLITESVGV